MWIKPRFHLLICFPTPLKEKVDSDLRTIRLYEFICMYVYIYIHTYIQTYIHKYIQTYIPSYTTSEKPSCMNSDWITFNLSAIILEQLTSPHCNFEFVFQQNFPLHNNANSLVLLDQHHLSNKITLHLFKFRIKKIVQINQMPFNYSIKFYSFFI